MLANMQDGVTRRNYGLASQATIVLALVGAVLGAPETVFAATTLDVALPTVTVDGGGSFDITVTANSTGGDVNGLYLEVSYDPSVVRLMGWTIGPGWIEGSDFSGSATGTVDIGAFAYPDFPAPSRSVLCTQAQSVCRETRLR